MSYGYDEYQLDPPYIDYEASRTNNPGILRQHMASDMRVGQSAEIYNSAPFGMKSYSSSGPRTEVSNMSTFVLEQKVQEIAGRINYIFWMMVLVLMLVFITMVICVVSTFTMVTINKKNS
jgi:hypothetical protein